MWYVMNDRFIDFLSVFSVLLQLENYESDLKSVHNEDLMQELQKQNKDYLEQIIVLLKEILTKIG